MHVFVPLSAASQATGRQGHDRFQLCTIFLCVCKRWASVLGSTCVCVVGICARARDAMYKEAGVSHRGCLSFATLQLYP